MSKTHVCALRAYETKTKRSLDTATPLYKNIKSTWNSVMSWSLKRIYVHVVTIETKQKQYHWMQQSRYKGISRVHKIC